MNTGKRLRGGGGIRWDSDEYHVLLQETGQGYIVKVKDLSVVTENMTWLRILPTYAGESLSDAMEVVRGYIPDAKHKDEG